MAVQRDALGDLDRLAAGDERVPVVVGELLRERREQAPDVASDAAPGQQRACVDGDPHGRSVRAVA